MSRGSWFAGALFGLVVGCNGDHARPTPDASAKLLFDENVRQAYAPARACRSPGEHSGLNAFTVWVSPDSAAAFDALWQTPPALARLPAGTVVVKEVYSGTSCDEADVERWVAMKKEPGFDPAHADWHWQEVTANGRVLSDGATTACIDCHRGGDDMTCIGYGELNGRDYTCTVPDHDGGM